MMCLTKSSFIDLIILVLISSFHNIIPKNSEEMPENQILSPVYDWLSHKYQLSIFSTWSNPIQANHLYWVIMISIIGFRHTILAIDMYSDIFGISDIFWLLSTSWYIYGILFWLQYFLMTSIADFVDDIFHQVSI